MITLTAPQMADRLMHNSYSDGVTRVMRPGRDGMITFNASDLTAQEQTLARNALAEIEQLTGLDFRETTGSAQIVYTNDGTGANTRTTASGTTITSARVRIASDRVEPGDGYGSYAFRTYMHETLHGLGLGHPQDYGTVREFWQSGIANDSWQMTIMSYFDQDENTRVQATKAYHLTPMLADYLALRAMYGDVAVHAGNTTYGVGSTAGGALDRAALLGPRVTFLIADDGGVDAVNFSRTVASQVITLRSGAFSDVMGGIGNMHIAPDTVIEHATGGSGNDILTGNAAANRLDGGSGTDRLAGALGNDALRGGAGDDRLLGEGGDDALDGGIGNDQLFGGAGNDRLRDDAGSNLLDGGAGNDAMTGGAMNDRLLGGVGSDTLNGAAGNDRAEGGDGGDRLFGLAGHDTLHGGGAHDILIGGDGDDWLSGGAGHDDLAAGSGTDVLDGGPGDDMLRGGAGRDRFVFNDGIDRARGFDAAVDIIDVRSFGGLDSWADVRAHLSQSGNHVAFRHGDNTLVIEWSRLTELDATDFLW